MTDSYSKKLKTICLSTLSAMVLTTSVNAASVLDIDDLVRPVSSSANTFVTGNNNTFASTATKGSSPTTMTFTANNGILLAYFDPVSLTNIGDSITFSFNATFSNFNNAARGFRIGLFNHGTATKMTADGAASTSFANYNGYALNTRATGASTTSNEIYRRSASQTGLFAATSSPSMTTSVNALNLTNGNTYSGSFSLQLTAVDTILLTWKFGSEASQSFTDSVAGIVKNFDTVAIFNLNSLSPAAASQMVFTKFDVDYTAAVPEPSFAFVVAGALGFLIWRRRR